MRSLPVRMCAQPFSSSLRPLAAIAVSALAMAQAHGSSIFPRVSFMWAPWATYSGNPQHTGLSRYASASMDQINWSYDIDPQQPAGQEILVHYGSPVITRKNTVIFPVATQTDTTWQFVAVPTGASGSNPAALWTFNTDYLLPPCSWTPPVEGSIVNRSSYAMPGIGGKVFYKTDVEDPASEVRSLYFYGESNHTANQAWADANIKICTPIMADGRGNMWFGYYVGDSNPFNSVTYPSGFPDLGRGGLARLNTAGVGTWIKATDATGDATINFAGLASAPALSNDVKYVYMAFFRQYNDNSGSLVKLDARTLAVKGSVALNSPHINSGTGLPYPGRVHIASSGCPMVGPDGDVYMGVFGSGGFSGDYRESHGWMLHFDGNLNLKGAIGAFGWDDTATIVPSSIVPQYTGTSSYLLLTKYNNYAWSDFWSTPVDPGADGQNMVALLDPNDSSGIDRQTGLNCMNPVIVVYGITPDTENPLVAGAVREWCINSAAIDPFGKCAIVNSEDGNCYKWDFTSNSLQPVKNGVTGVQLNAPIGEAYTPTVIGPDGTVYAINNHKLYAIGPTP